MAPGSLGAHHAGHAQRHQEHGCTAQHGQQQQQHYRAGRSEDGLDSEFEFEFGPGQEHMAGWVCNRPPLLVAQIHDELLVECDGRSEHVMCVAQALKGIMGGVMQLSVPLIVNISQGPSWGSMEKVNV